MKQTHHIPAGIVRPSPRDDARAWSPPSGDGRIRRWPVDPCLRSCWMLGQIYCQSDHRPAAAEVAAAEVRPMWWCLGRFHRRLVWTTNKCRPLTYRSRLLRDGYGCCLMSDSSFHVCCFLNTMRNCVKSIPLPCFPLSSSSPISFNYYGSHLR